MQTNIQNIGMLRQWINERPVNSPLLTNEDILYWLELDIPSIEVESKYSAQERQEVTQGDKWDSISGRTQFCHVCAFGGEIPESELPAHTCGLGNKDPEYFWGNK